MDQTNFTGLESVADAVEYLYTGKNVGKVVVHLNPNTRKSAL
jgi:NADPH-dependent curcumin reductase CurA